MVKDFFHLARPTQYVKNLFIFLPIFFAFEFDDFSLLKGALISFFAFSFIASAVYGINDWRDRAADAQHPEKKNRPIASGRIGWLFVIVFVLTMGMSGLALGGIVSDSVFKLLLVYLALNIGYSFGLKNVAIVDVFIISSGFVIRLLVGSFSTDIALSQWIVVMTFLLALFLSLAKRRDDEVIYFKTKNKVRKASGGYNLLFLDASLVMTSTIVVLAYILWSISPEVQGRIGSVHLYITSVFVVLGVMRYLQIAFVEQLSGNPTKVLLSDKFIQVTISLWVITIYALVSA